MARLLMISLLFVCISANSAQEKNIFTRIFDPYKQAGLNSLTCEISISFDDSNMSALNPYIPNLILKFKKPESFKLSYTLLPQTPEDVKTVVEQMMEQSFCKKDFIEFGSGLVALQKDFKIASTKNTTTEIRINLTAATKNAIAQKMTVRLDKNYRMTGFEADKDRVRQESAFTYITVGKFQMVDRIVNTTSEAGKKVNIIVKYSKYKIN
ncbi:MAG: hypothetical protein PHW04_05660 [Candidatus Wallbacteria bacterium]|nr:hypothetical protein [Candidatus Wallbacteria bacterium]